MLAMCVCMYVCIHRHFGSSSLIAAEPFCRPSRARDSSATMILSIEVVKHGFLDPNDPVAISFWIISISMVASTMFFLMESLAVSDHWKTSMNVGALVTLVALHISRYCCAVTSADHTIILVARSASTEVYSHYLWRNDLPSQSSNVVGKR